MLMHQRAWWCARWDAGTVPTSHLIWLATLVGNKSAFPISVMKHEQDNGQTKASGFIQNSLSNENRKQIVLICEDGESVEFQ